MTTAADGGIASKLAAYAEVRGISRNSAEWRGLLKGYQQNPAGFAELLDMDLRRIRDATGI